MARMISSRLLAYYAYQKKMKDRQPEDPVQHAFLQGWMEGRAHDPRVEILTEHLELIYSDAKADHSSPDEREAKELLERLDEAERA